MKKRIQNFALWFFKRIFRRIGFDVILNRKHPIDFNEREARILASVRPYTMTSPERVFSLIHAVDHVIKYNIEGAMVECGVWKGGSSMTIATVLKERGEERDLYLYDTFEGMSVPTEHDVSIFGDPASGKFSKLRISDDSSEWCASPLDDVKANLNKTGYPQDRIHYIKGKIEETIPDTMPDKIALLRLDTDWYESTRHELIHLFPLMSPGSVIIIDDYGHWQGARKAVDEYWAANNVQLMLNRIDQTGRIGVKT